MSSTSDNVSLSSSSSRSMQSRENVGRCPKEGSVSPTVVVGRIPMETITKVRETSHIIIKGYCHGVLKSLFIIIQKNT